MALPGTKFNFTFQSPDGCGRDPIAEIIAEVGSKATAAPKAKQIQYNEALTRKLYEAVRDDKAYLDEVGKGKDKSKTKAAKWAKIAGTTLGQDAAFAAYLPLSADQLKKKFIRDMDKVSVKYALEKEGSNLSGLTEKDIVDPLELMLYSMKIKELKYGREREAIKEKEKKRNLDMLKHEDSVLKGEADEGEGDSEGDENEHPNPNPSSMRKSKLLKREPGMSATPNNTSSEEEKFQKSMETLLSGLLPSKELLELQLKEKQVDIEAKQAAIENQKALTQMMLVMLNKQ